MSVSGTTLSQGELLQRTIVAFGYVTLSMLSVAAIALLLSTLDRLRVRRRTGHHRLPDRLHRCCWGSTPRTRSEPYLPTRYWLSFVDLFRDPIRLGTAWCGGCSASSPTSWCFLTAAWANFASRTSTADPRSGRGTESVPSVASQGRRNVTGSPGRSPWLVRAPGHSSCTLEVDRPVELGGVRRGRRS